MADKISLPSGQAGLTRYDEEYHSKFALNPKTVFVIIAIVVILLLALMYNAGEYGNLLLGLS